jgi:hypothetical protein
MEEEDMHEQAYVQIAEKVDKNYQTAPKPGDDLSQAFIAYLKIVYALEEADLVQHLFMPPVFKTLEELADATGKSTDDVQNILTSLIEKGFILASKGQYCIPSIPRLLNLHMFYPDIHPKDLEAAKLYQQFFIKEKYYNYYGTSSKGTPMLRAIPINKTIHPEEKTLGADEAHQFIQGLQTEDLQLVPCPCRTRTEKLDIRECRDKFPIGNCIFIEGAARHIEKFGNGQSGDQGAGHSILGRHGGARPGCHHYESYDRTLLHNLPVLRLLLFQCARPDGLGQSHCGSAFPLYPDRRR